MLSEKLEVVLLLLDNPREAIELIIIEKPVLFSLVVFTLANLSFLISYPVLSRSLNISFIVIFLFALLINFLVLITTACTYHFVAELFKGRGDVITLFALLNFSLLPMLLMVPVGIIGKFAGPGLGYFVFIIITLWVIYLALLSIKILYDISTLKALITVLSPYIIVVILFLIISVISIAGILSYLV